MNAAVVAAFQPIAVEKFNWGADQIAQALELDCNHDDYHSLLSLSSLFVELDTGESSLVGRVYRRRPHLRPAPAPREAAGRYLLLLLLLLFIIIIIYYYVDYTAPAPREAAGATTAHLPTPRLSSPPISM